ncbi:MAG: serine/threonine-protein kinase [Planctomycetota bacterium]
MDELDPSSKTDFSSFYDVAENQDQIDEQVISPSLHAVGSIRERYQSAEFIASGGMKQVFKVYDARCKRYVAMATLHDDAPLELCDPLIHEAWLTGLLDHPNIMTIHDVGVDSNDRPFFTMDLKAGDSLNGLIEKLHAGDVEVQCRYPLETLLQVFVKICDAIAYAHSIGVLHLDLKPANIQVGHFGEVLVCDWGLGRVLRREDGIEFERLLLNSDLLSSNTLFGEVRGTPGYMAPEQIEKDGLRDKQTDIYQLGCILYSLLTLQAPVSGSPKEAIEQTRRGEIISPRKRSPQREIPASLDAVSMKAMEVKPADRYESVELLSEEVRRYLTGFATRAEQAGVLTQLKLLYKRNQRFCTTVLCSALLLLAGAAWSYWTMAEKERLATSARLDAEQTLALYEAGKDEVEMLSIQNAESVEKAAVQMHVAGNEVSSEQLLLTALQAEPGNSVYLRAMGEHYFIMQRFKEATKYLDRGEKRTEWPDQLVSDLAHEYAERKPNDNQKLTTQQLIELLQAIQGFNGFEAMIVLNDQRDRVDPYQRAEIIKEHLRSINPNWNDGWFEYDFAGGRLRVGGKGLERLSESRSVLAGLHPRTLDISGSDVTSLWQESGYGLETLDVRGCPVESVVLQRFLHLKTLIIQPGQFTEEELSSLPDWVTVIEKP